MAALLPALVPALCAGGPLLQPNLLPLGRWGRGAATPQGSAPRGVSGRLEVHACTAPLVSWPPQDYAAQYAREIGELLRRMPRPLLLLLKTNDCLRWAGQRAWKRTGVGAGLMVSQPKAEQATAACLHGHPCSTWLCRALVPARPPGQASAGVHSSVNSHLESLCIARACT